MKSTISKRKVKRACVDCHFLTELEFRSLPDDFTVDPPFVNGFEIIYEELHPYKREQAKKKDYSQFKSLTRGPLRCYLECWEERGLRPDQKLDEVRHERIVETDRNDCCFFFEYKQTMSFKAAEEMQKRLTVLPVGKHKEKETPARFPTPPDSKWSDVEITFIDGEHVNIKVKDDIKSGVHYSQMGFKHETAIKHIQLWDTLRTFAFANGIITPRFDTKGKLIKPVSSDDVKRLRKKLKSYFDISGSPIPRYDKGTYIKKEDGGKEFIKGEGYKTSFVIKDDSALIKQKDEFIDTADIEPDY